MSNELAKANEPITPFDQSQIDILRNTLFKGFSDDEMKFCLAVCSRSGLDPFARQIHFNKRRNKATGKESITIVTGIDGFRATAQRSGAYAGSSEPVYQIDKDNKPTKATCTVQKIVQGHLVSFTASAYWNEFYPGDVPESFMWRKMPFQMLGKVAEAQALRKGFPVELSGIYAPEEMDQAKDARQGDVKAREVQAILEGAAPESKTNNTEVPHFEPELGDPGLRTIKIGKQFAGMKYQDVDLNQLQKFVDWARVQKEPSASLKEFLTDALAYLESL